MEKEYVNWKYLTVLKFRAQLSDVLRGQLQDSTIALNDQALADFARLVGDKLLRSVGVYDVERFKSLRLKEVSAPKVAIDYRQLKAAFSRAVQFGMIPKNVFKDSKSPRIPEKEPLYLTPKEFDALCEGTTDQQLKDMMVFAVCTAMRVGELVNVRPEDIDLAGPAVHLKNRPDFTLKGKRQRSIPLNATCLSLLAALKPEGAFLFCNRKGGRLSARWVSERFRRAKEKAGFPKGIHFHSLRHTGASWLVQSGVPLAYVQRILGHYSITTTQIYVHSAPAHLRESVERLDALIEGAIASRLVPKQLSRGGDNDSVLAKSLAVRGGGAASAEV